MKTITCPICHKSATVEWKDEACWVCKPYEVETKSAIDIAKADIGRGSYMKDQAKKAFFPSARFDQMKVGTGSAED